MKCNQPDCDGAVVAKKLCARHYKQQRRKRLGKTKTIAPPGKGAAVTFRIHADTLGAVENLAKLKKITLSELVREAVDDLLDAYGLTGEKAPCETPTKN